MNDLKGIIEDCNKSDLVSDKVIKKIIEIIGQEKWNDIHDEESDICTTMGELIITLKGIAELEKENAELKGRNAELKGMYAHSAREAGTYKQFLEAKEKENAELKEELTKKADTNHSLVVQMADLESENAELKEKYAKNITDCDICDTYCNSQLTKAKELLRYYFDCFKNDNKYTLSDFEVVEDTEQFLKESV